MLAKDPMFIYEQAFARNIGWVTHAEQKVLRQARVAIAGMGGVGGVHLMTLVRLGIGHFHIADLDCFEVANINRQAGASISTLGEPKVEVMARMACDVNPDVEIRSFASGVGPGNLTDFLEGVDLYVDGLDFFAFDARAETFSACDRLGIPAVTAAPLGMGAAVLNFLPGGMSFEDYFGWAGRGDDEKALRFMIGLAPRLLQDYIADPGSVDLRARRGPSTVMACQICAGMAATEVLKLLLSRGERRSAPHGVQFDAYRQKFVRTWRPGGHRNPVQRLMLAIARQRLAAMKRAASNAEGS